MQRADRGVLACLPRGEAERRRIGRDVAARAVHGVRDAERIAPAGDENTRTHRQRHAPAAPVDARDLRGRGHVSVQAVIAEQRGAAGLAEFEHRLAERHGEAIPGRCGARDPRAILVRDRHARGVPGLVHRVVLPVDHAARPDGERAGRSRDAEQECDRRR